MVIVMVTVIVMVMEIDGGVGDGDGDGGEWKTLEATPTKTLLKNFDKSIFYFWNLDGYLNGERLFKWSRSHSFDSKLSLKLVRELMRRGETRGERKEEGGGRKEEGRERREERGEWREREREREERERRERERGGRGERRERERREERGERREEEGGGEGRRGDRRQAREERRGERRGQEEKGGKREANNLQTCSEFISVKQPALLIVACIIYFLTKVSGAIPMNVICPNLSRKIQRLFAASTLALTKD